MASHTDAACRLSHPDEPMGGLVLLERHLEKNAGSTFREVLAHSEHQGRCMYWGFQQRSLAWLKLIAACNLTAASEAAAAVHRGAFGH